MKNKILITSPDACRHFFRNVRPYNSSEKPQIWDIKSICPTLSDADLAIKLSEFFNTISNEFSPLVPTDIPVSFPRDLPVLRPYQVSERIPRIKKPRSKIRGDIFPNLMTEFSDLLAQPLCDIYNTITETLIWPTVWKVEIVTVIPKCAAPEEFDQLRNISCTLLVSKIYESYLLSWIREEVTVRHNQYGGVRGCSTQHHLLHTWETILEDLEDSRSATVLTSIDFSKGFNRVSHQHCLKAFAAHGASTPVLALLATFLQDRTMTVRINKDFSPPLPVNGGCPLGSLLGVYLFNVSIDDIEQSPAAILEETTENDIRVGDFF